MRSLAKKVLIGYTLVGFTTLHHKVDGTAVFSYIMQWRNQDWCVHKNRTPHSCHVNVIFRDFIKQFNCKVASKFYVDSFLNA